MSNTIQAIKDETTSIKRNSVSVVDNNETATTAQKTIEVLNTEYTLSSPGMYKGQLLGGVPQWVEEAINQAINSKFKNIEEQLNNLSSSITASINGLNESLTIVTGDVETRLRSELESGDRDITAELDINYKVSSSVDEAIAIATTALRSEYKNYTNTAIANLSTTYKTIANVNAAIAEIDTKLESKYNKDSIADLALTYETIADANQARASIEQDLTAKYDGLDVTLQEHSEVVTGHFTQWVEGTDPKLGQFKQVGDIYYQYLGGTLGPNGDGWVRMDQDAIEKINIGLSTLNNELTTQINDLQIQVDKAITTWFKDGTPEFSVNDAKYSSDNTSADVVTNDFVFELVHSQMYKYLGDNDTVDLTNTDFSDTALWLSIYKINTAESEWYEIDNVKIDDGYYWYDTDGIQPRVDNDKDVTTTERDRHLKDLYYDRLTGRAYRYVYNDISDDSPDRGIVYYWVYITDVDITKALSDASRAQDTADGKRTIFGGDSVPSSRVINGHSIAIQTGDLWIPESDVTDNNGNEYIEGEIYRYVEGHTPTQWVKIENYKYAIADVQQEFDKWKDKTYMPFVNDIKAQVDKKAETFYQNTVPANHTTAIGVVDSSDLDKYIGDLWKNTSTDPIKIKDNADNVIATYQGKNTEYIYSKIPNESNDTEFDYKWVEMEVPDIVYDKIDTKKAIYVQIDIPTNPEINDMWIPAEPDEWSVKEYDIGDIVKYRSNSSEKYKSYKAKNDIADTETEAPATDTANWELYPYESKEIYTYDGSNWTITTKYTEDLSKFVQATTMESHNIHLFTSNSASPAPGESDFVDTAGNGNNVQPSVGDLWRRTDENYGGVYAQTNKLYKYVSNNGNLSWELLPIEKAAVYGWIGGANKLLTDPETGSVTGWSFGDGSAVQSQFNISADHFAITKAGVPGNKVFNPFSIDMDGDSDDVQIKFNGAVEFSSVQGGPKTIRGPGMPGITGEFTITDESKGIATIYSWNLIPNTRPMLLVYIDEDNHQYTIGTWGVHYGFNIYTYEFTDDSVGKTFSINSSTGIKAGVVTADMKTALEIGSVYASTESSIEPLIVNANHEYQLISSLAPNEVANAINTNTTTIDGGKITTGSITAYQIHSNTIEGDNIKADTIDTDKIKISNIANAVNNRIANMINKGMISEATTNYQHPLIGGDSGFGIKSSDSTIAEIPVKLKDNITYSMFLKIKTDEATSDNPFLIDCELELTDVEANKYNEVFTASTTSDWQVFTHTFSFALLNKDIDTSLLRFKINDKETAGKSVYITDITLIEGNTVLTKWIGASLTEQTIIDGSRITTGTIDADKVTVTNLNASNITTGTIDASAIGVTNLNADNIAAGKLSSKDNKTYIDLTTNKVYIKNTTENFILNSEAQGTTDDPNIQGGYIKGTSIEGGSIKGATIEADSIKTGTIDIARLPAITIKDSEKFTDEQYLDDDEKFKYMHAYIEIPNKPFVNDKVTLTITVNIILKDGEDNQCTTPLIGVLKRQSIAPSSGDPDWQFHISGVATHSFTLEVEKDYTYYLMGKVFPEQMSTYKTYYTARELSYVGYLK